MESRVAEIFIITLQMVYLLRYTWIWISLTSIDHTRICLLGFCSKDVDLVKETEAAQKAQTEAHQIWVRYVTTGTVTLAVVLWLLTVTVLTVSELWVLLPRLLLSWLLFPIKIIFFFRDIGFPWLPISVSLVTDENDDARYCVLWSEDG